MLRKTEESKTSTAVITRELLTAEEKHADAPKILASLDYNAITFSKTLCQGELATIHKGYYQFKSIIIKEYRFSKDNNQPELSFIRAITTLTACFASDFIVQSIGYCLKPPIIVMEYVKNGDLGNYLFNHYLSFSRAINIANDVALGLLKLLQKNWVHTDIKPANVLLTENYRAKICDFDGVVDASYQPNQKEMLRMGTTLYLAPEFYPNCKFTLQNGGLPAADVFSYGMLLFQLFIAINDEFIIFHNKHSPNTSISLTNQPRHKIDSLNQLLNDGDFSKIPSHLQTEIKNIIRSCIQENPDDRPTLGIIQRNLQTIINAEEEPKASASAAHTVALSPKKAVDSASAAVQTTQTVALCRCQSAATTARVKTIANPTHPAEATRQIQNEGFFAHLAHAIFKPRQTLPSSKNSQNKTIEKRNQKISGVRR